MKAVLRRGFTFSAILYLFVVLANPINASKDSEESGEKKTTPKPKKINVAKAEKNITDSAKNMGVKDDGTVVYKTTSTQELPFMFGLETLTLFKNIEQINPKKTTKTPVRFVLFNKDNKKIGQPLTFETQVEDTKWIPGQKVVFLIHGFVQQVDLMTMSDDDTEFKTAKTSEKIKNAYIDEDRSENLVLVNWVAGSYLDYSKAARNSYLVGEVLAHMIISLKTRNFFTYQQVKLVGFSLGAHVAGVAGYFIHQRLGIRVGEITGLDPTGLMFEATKDKKIRLDKSDAEFVQVIHCNLADVSLTGSTNLGTNLELGHVDFYPNGGSKQKGCNSNAVCSHQRCPALYASTVRGREYKGCECENVQKYTKGSCTTCDGPLMGDLCPTTASGKYYMEAVPEDDDKLDKS